MGPRTRPRGLHLLVFSLLGAHTPVCLGQHDHAWVRWFVECLVVLKPGCMCRGPLQQAVADEQPPRDQALGSRQVRPGSRQAGNMSSDQAPKRQEIRTNKRIL